MTGLDIYTQPIVDEAMKRGIKTISYPEASQSIVILKYKNHKEFISQSTSNSLGVVTRKVIDNKFLTNKILSQLKIPITQNILTRDIDEAKSFLTKHKKIVIKPSDRSSGIGITANIINSEELLPAMKYAQRHTKRKDKKIICEQYMKGFDHRILIVNKKYIFGIKREPAHVIGDGKNTIINLIKNWNKEVKINVCKIKIGQKTKTFLENQSLTLSYIPKNKEKIYLNNLGNAHEGGISFDITDSLCRQVKLIAKKIAKFFNAPTLGIDFISEDISKSPGYVVEVNALPGIPIHLTPSFGKSRNVTKHIVDMLFPETAEKTFSRRP